MPNTLAIRLPPELKLCIGTFCTATDLASLALIHTSYTAEAERALYHTLALDAGKEQACLQTLSSNHQKASMVHSMSIRFKMIHRWNDDYHLNVVETLSDALAHTSKLRDLRIHLPSGIPERAQDMLNRVLLGGDLKLSTLYCSDSLNITGIIKCHAELEFVGIYAFHRPRDVFNILKDIYIPDSSLPIPTVVEFERDTFLPHFNCLAIFPAFSLDPALICQNVCRSIDQHSWHDGWTSREQISGLYVYFRDSFDMGIIRDVLDGIASSFPEVCELNFAFEQAGQIQYAEFIKALAPLAYTIEGLHFAMSDYRHQGESAETSIDAKMAQVKEWTTTLPRLLSVTFLNGTLITRHNKDLDWIV